MPIPFTVIGGFLGAGKTTLLNRVLREARDERVAVLVNDFGAINVDADLVVEHGGETIALANGCICCSIGDSLMDTLIRILSAPQPVDRILVEASGVSDPARIADMARIDRALTLDGVVVLADAAEVRAHAADRFVGDAVRGQIAVADIVLLNKADLTDEGAFAEHAEGSPQHTNQHAAILACDPSDFEVDALMGTKVEPGTKAGRSRPRVAFHTLTLEAELPIPSAAFARFSATLPVCVIRGKGKVAIKGEPGGVQWQRVGARTNTTSLEVPPEVSRIVLIGTAPLTKLPNVPSKRRLCPDPVRPSRSKRDCCIAEVRAERMKRSTSEEGGMRRDPFKGDIDFHVRSSCLLCGGTAGFLYFAGRPASAQERGITVDRATLFRWVQKIGSEIAKRAYNHRSWRGLNWHVPFRDIALPGNRRDLCLGRRQVALLWRAVDQKGQFIDFRLTARRDAKAAKAFLN